MVLNPSSLLGVGGREASFDEPGVKTSFLLIAFAVEAVSGEVGSGKKCVLALGAY